MTAVLETRADLSTADVNDLPDSAFAYIEPGGSKDGEGKTTPRSKRHFPVHDAAHTRNALARLSSSPFGDKAKAAVHAAAKRFGIEVSEESAAQRDPGWEQRRKRWAGSLVRQAGRRSMKLARGNIEVRAKDDGTGGTNFEFHGWGATFDDWFEMWDPWGDPYEEGVKPGAFSRSLARQDLDTPFLIGHNDAGIPLARTWQTLTMSQDSRGLETLAKMNGRRSDVRDLALAVGDGNIDEMSIGFVTRGQEWSDDWSRRYMTDLDLHRGDVSVVALAANSATKGASMVALPTETLSRQAAGQRASHGPYSGTHTHEHPAFGSQGGDRDHEHEHDHNDDADHDHMHPRVGGNDRSAAGPGEQLAARGEINDSSNQPDFNLPSGPAPYDAAAHSWKPSVSCPNKDCPVYSNGDGQAQNEMDSRRCDQCGGPLYDGDGLIVMDDSGVVEEVGGSMADADLLSRRLRLLELA